MARIWIITLIMVLIPFAMPTAQEQPAQVREFRPESWQKAKEGLDYSADVLSEKKRTNTPKENAGGKILGWEGGNAATFMKWLSFVLAAVALIFLLRGLLKLRSPKDKKIKTTLSVAQLAEVEKNIHAADFDDLIRQAIATKNFSLAIRLYYLSILKTLTQKNLIRWQPDKTNREYLREMQSSVFFDNFREITAWFEYVWYGERTLSSEDFQQIAPKFRTLEQQINALSTPEVR